MQFEYAQYQGCYSIVLHHTTFLFHLSILSSLGKGLLHSSGVMDGSGPLLPPP